MDRTEPSIGFAIGSAALRLKVALPGEVTVRRRTSEGRRGEVPKSEIGIPPVPPVDFAPSFNWFRNNAERAIDCLAIHQTCQ
jgi:hypothetical protein